LFHQIDFKMATEIVLNSAYVVRVLYLFNSNIRSFFYLKMGAFLIALTIKSR
jgi:hypothetical protein